jgi:hypothetical protein
MEAARKTRKECKSPAVELSRSCRQLRSPAHNPKTLFQQHSAYPISQSLSVKNTTPLATVAGKTNLLSMV